MWGLLVGTWVSDGAQRFLEGEDFQSARVCDDAGFTRETAGYGSTSFCGEYTYPRSDERCQLKGFILSNTKIGPVLELMVTERCDREGNETKIDSLKKEGIQSWMVISRDDDSLRKNKEQNNFYRLHFRHQFCRSKNESGMIHFPLLTTIAETFQTRWLFFFNIMMVFEKTMGRKV